MDSVEGASRGEALRENVLRAQTLLQRAASAASTHGDPVAPQLQAMLYALGAMTDIHDAVFAMQAEFLQALQTHTDNVTKVAPEIARASAMSISKELGPQLITAAMPTMRQTFRMLSLRAVAGATAALAAIVLLVGAFSYTSGLGTGRIQGEDAARAIQAAMAAGPNAAMDWALLMANNDPGPELAECRKSIATDGYGRRSCSLPIWLDPVQTGRP